MSEFRADVRDLKFVLFEQMNLAPLLATERYGHFSKEDMEMILEEAYKFSREILAPSNVPGDRTGCTLNDGKVSVPDELKNAYARFCEGGWISLTCNPDWGGQGAPELLRVAVDDMFWGANIGLLIGIMLTPSAGHVIEKFASDELKETYLRKIYSGEWTGTMCLTEPQAGSDVGAATTRAIKHDDHYLIEGEKIFITYGDHNMTDNIVHCVLARTEGSPKGTKGLSLFVVPKFRPNADGTPGEFNDVVATKLEEKMGLHGSPTCAMHFGPNGQCHGWLLGEERQGMKMMFQMMNEARVHVGLQGAALGNAAYQAAAQYAKERLQGSDIRRFKDPEAPRVPIIRHPDVRVMLMRQKAYCEGMRALLMFASYCGDRSRIERRQQDQQKYQGLLDFLTPICKAYCSDMGFRVTEWAIQTFGGYGYLKEYPVEQYMRDCKIASLYEGTNGIQALDLVGRKLSANGGANVMALAGLLSEFLEKNAHHPRLKAQVEALGEARAQWGKVNAFFLKMVTQRKLMVPLLNATSYLSLCGDLLLGYLLLEQAVIADEKLQALYKKEGLLASDDDGKRKLIEGNADARYFDSKVKTAQFFISYELPNIQAKATAIQSEDTCAFDHLWAEELE